jgi:magnesium chelatase family protein
MEDGVFFMYSKVLSCCVQGIEGQLVVVEVDLSNGLPQFNIVGLPDSAVRESIERVRAAIKNCRYEFPMKRITVNLAPANLRKEGAAFDLAIALGILIASGQLNMEELGSTLIIGELSLDGTLREIPGVLSMVIDAQKQGVKSVILPEKNAREASLIEGIKVYALSHLEDLKSQLSGFLINDINNSSHLINCDFTAGFETSHAPVMQEDFIDVRGQFQAKRALMVAASGMHNIVLVGPPGSGKTMLMRRFPSILPPLNQDEALEVTKIYSVANQLSHRSQLIVQRPFRSPHHTISQGGLVGGGSVPKPGEISLAHCGILYLDEFPEFSRYVLEVLRQPLEDKQVTISRAKAVYSFPANFLLAASMNPCPCGYMGSETESNTCLCSPLKVRQYRAKISGPLLDRIDLHVDVPRIDYQTFAADEQKENSSSLEMRETIFASQLIQMERYKGTDIRFNSQLSGKLLRQHCQLNKEAGALLSQSFDAIGLSVRSHDRILKIARTLADLEASDSIECRHVAEAINYRSLDRKYTK